MHFKCQQILVVLFFLVITKTFGLLDINLINEYYKLKPINKIIVLSCEEKFTIPLLSSINKNNIYITNYDVNKIKAEIIKSFFLKMGQQGLILDMECKNSSLILKDCAAAKLFYEKNYWLIFAETNKSVDHFRDIELNVNAEITLAFYEQNNWILLDIYNPGYKNGGKLKVNNLGTWNSKNSFNFTHPLNISKYILRQDFTGLNITGTIALLSEYPGDLLDYLYNNEENRTVDNFARLYFRLFDHVKDIHNFTLYVNLEATFGYVQPNGLFGGMIGFLERHEVDVALTPVYYKLERLPVVEFLVPTYFMTTGFLFRHPKPGLTINGAFFTPLENEVWLCTWGVMFITAIIIRLTFKEEWKYERLKNDTDNYTEHDWSYIALLIFGGICQQDVPRVPNFYSGRTIVFVSVFFTYMLYQFYSGGIVSSLLSEPPKTINTLEDLLHSSLKVGVEDKIYNKDYLENAVDPVAIELFKTKIIGQKNGSDAYYDEKTGMKLVKEGGFAFQTDTCYSYITIAREFSNQALCELGQVPLFASQYTVGMVPKMSPLKEILLNSFQRMRECGVIERQRLRWTTPKPECIKVMDSNTIFVGIKEFFPAILFFVIGVIISLIIFGCEILIYKRKSAAKKERRNRKLFGELFQQDMY